MIPRKCSQSGAASGIQLAARARVSATASCTKNLASSVETATPRDLGRQFTLDRVETSRFDAFRLLGGHVLFVLSHGVMDGKPYADFSNWSNVQYSINNQ
jgi:hypothetical protein